MRGDRGLPKGAGAVCRSAGVPLPAHAPGLGRPGAFSASLPHACGPSVPAPRLWSSLTCPRDCPPPPRPPAAAKGPVLHPPATSFHNTAPRATPPYHTIRPHGNTTTSQHRATTCGPHHHATPERLAIPPSAIRHPSRRADPILQPVPTPTALPPCHQRRHHHLWTHVVPLGNAQPHRAPCARVCLKVDAPADRTFPLCLARLCTRGLGQRWPDPELDVCRRGGNAPPLTIPCSSAHRIRPN